MLYIFGLQMEFLKIFLLFLYLNLLPCIVIDDQPYCSLRYRRLCKGKGTHVACQFPTPGPGISCQNYSQIKFTSGSRHFITNYINRRRQRIASGGERVRGGAHLPPPQIMMLVSWDRELAHLAQRLADQCEFEHDDCRATLRYPYAGQSVGEVRWRRSSDSEQLSVQRTIRRVFDAWWGERRRVQPAQLTGPFKLEPKGTVWGHFSQLAVWTLRAVGCGAVRYGYQYTRFLLVCDFSHTNMLGQRTLHAGPVAPCPDGTIRKPRTNYHLLCAPVRRPDENDHRKSDYEEDYEESTQTRATPRVTAGRRTFDNKYMEMGERDVEDRLTKYVELNENPKSTRRVVEIIEEEFGRRNQEQTRKNNQWFTRRTYGKFREHLEEKESKVATYEDEDAKNEEYKTLGTGKFVSTYHESILRHKWQRTRKRLQRPGANALLKKPPEKPLRRHSLSSLMLDQDDIDQFFRDTGFNVNWRKQPLPR